jgi:N-acetylglucosaminyldiphosphoundecaprenol N-acetyl-beta-D-mannosaminyltransferase
MLRGIKMEKCNIIGVRINCINMGKTLIAIQDELKRKRSNYICVSNVHTTVMAYEDSYYRKIQNESFMSLPDGMPLSVICKKRGYKNTERVAGPDLMGEIFRISEEKEYTHYFYGSTEETLVKLKKKLTEKYPKLKIEGMYAPPFLESVREENPEIISNINRIGPDFLWVGLGAPKQEKWMYKQKGKINSLMIGVGAGFDYYAGNIKRAPKWMQNLSLEWLHRLIQDPKRLLKRYFTTNFKFILYTRKYQVDIREGLKCKG